MIATRQLKILLHADLRPDRLGASYSRAFTALGHIVVPVGEVGRSDLAPWLQTRVGHRLTARSLTARRRGAAPRNDRLLRVTRDAEPDLIILLNADFVMPETIRSLRTYSPVFIFHADNPFPGEGYVGPEHLVAARETDCYFIWSRSLRHRLLDAGLRRVEYLPFAWDEVVFPYLPPPVKTNHQVIFIGGWDRDREDWLEQIARHFSLEIWGPPYWATRTRSGSPLRRCWQGGEVRGPDAAHTIAHSGITLNILRRQNLPDGTNMRTFEVPGAGGFGLSTRTVGAQEIYSDNQMAVYFSSIDECCTAIERFLVDVPMRLELARFAHETTRKDQCYINRAEQIVEVYAEMTGDTIDHNQVPTWTGRV